MAGWLGSDHALLIAKFQDTRAEQFLKSCTWTSHENLSGFGQDSLDISLRTGRKRQSPFSSGLLPCHNSVCSCDKVYLLSYFHLAQTCCAEHISPTFNKCKTLVSFVPGWKPGQNKTPAPQNPVTYLVS